MRRADAEPAGVQAILGLKRYLAPSEGWLTFVFLVLTNLVVVVSLEQAEWVKPMPSLVVTSVIALSVGLVLAKARVPDSLLHVVSLLIGAHVVIQQMAALLPGATAVEQRLELWDRVSAWVVAAQTGGINSDTVPFALLLTSLVWLAGYMSSWSVFRWRQALGALVPSGIGLLVNLSYLPDQFALYFILFLFTSMLLVMRLNLVNQESGWKGAQLRGRMGWRFLIATSILGLIILTIAWQLPLAPTASELGSQWDRASGPWDKVESQFNRLFASLTSANAPPLHSFGDALPLRGSINLGNQVMLKIKSDVAGKWRAGTYDVYTGRGWVSGPRTTESSSSESVPSEGENYIKRKEVTQKVELYSPGDVIFAVGEPLRVDIPTRAQYTTTPNFTINLQDSSQDGELPPSLRSAAGVMRSALRRGGYSVSLEQVARFLPPDMRGLSITRRGPRINTVEVAANEAENHDIGALRATERLGRMTTYTVVSSVSIASQEDLRKAGEAYPNWVTNRFLQLPNIPSRVRSLAEEITSAANNPFDKARAIETYLRGLTYSLDVEPPPFDSDAVDYFLFESKAGYCDYFASSMAVMLRSIGIPARVAAGYQTGDYDIENGVYVVNESQAHSWPQVFFPTYGWIDWEPTPAWRIDDRNDDSSAIDESSSDLPSVTNDEDTPLNDEEGITGNEDMGYIPLSEPSPWDWAWPLSPVPLLGVLGLFAYWFVMQRGLRKLGYAARTYERVCRLGRLAGIGPRREETPYEYGRRLDSYFGTSSAEPIATSFVRDRYGRKKLTPDEIWETKAAWLDLRKKIFRYLVFRRRNGNGA